MKAKPRTKTTMGASWKNNIFISLGTLLSKRIKKAIYTDATAIIMSIKRRASLVLLRGNSRMKKILLKNLSRPIQIIERLRSREIYHISYDSWRPRSVRFAFGIDEMITANAKLFFVAWFLRYNIKVNGNEGLNSLSPWIQ